MHAVRKKFCYFDCRCLDGARSSSSISGCGFFLLAEPFPFFFGILEALLFAKRNIPGPSTGLTGVILNASAAALTEVKTGRSQSKPPEATILNEL